jgi:hypothetical protein
VSLPGGGNATGHGRTRPPRRIGLRLALPLAAGLLVALAPRDAVAADVEVTGDVVAQSYEVRGPWGDVVLGRRRLGTTVGLFVYHLQGDYQPLEADYSARLMMRMDADYGIDGAEASYGGPNSTRFVPGLELAPLDVLYGYVEGRHLWDGWFGFRVGRQMVTDALGWWSFDGATVRLTTPWVVQVEAYGGLEQRGGLPLSSSRYEAQGVWRGSRSQLGGAPEPYPSFQPADRAPGFGVALESDGPNWIHGRLTYRRVYNLGSATTGQFPLSGQYPEMSGTRISQDRLGYAMSAFLPGVGGLRGGFAYDLYNMLVSQAQGAVDVHLGSRVTIGADIDYYVPTFDADSIWNWFVHDPSTTVQARAAVRPLSRLDLSASAGVRLWSAAGDPTTFAAQQCAAVGATDPVALERCLALGLDPVSEGVHQAGQALEKERTNVVPDIIATLGAGYGWGTGQASLRGVGELGVPTSGVYRGRRVGGELGARQAIDGGRYWLGGALNLYEWDDPLRAGRETTSFGYVLAPEYVPAEFARVRLEWEHDMNELVGNRFRLLAVVHLQVLR